MGAVGRSRCELPQSARENSHFIVMTVGILGPKTYETTMYMYHAITDSKHAHLLEVIA